MKLGESKETHRIAVVVVVVVALQVGNEQQQRGASANKYNIVWTYENMGYFKIAVIEWPKIYDTSERFLKIDSVQQTKLKVVLFLFDHAFPCHY